MITPALRRRILSEWRGLPAPDPRPDRCVSVSDALGKLIPKLGLSERITEQEIQSAWRTIVGDFLAGHSTPSALEGGMLSVQVVQSTVRYELDRVWKPRILEKLQAQFGPRAVREIRFRS